MAREEFLPGHSRVYGGVMTRRNYAAEGALEHGAMKKIAACVLLLLCSNTFMNTAWYGHLRFKASPLWITILASWGIAFFEYCFQVPANRIGSGALTITQLKVIQEVVSLTTFALFAFVAFKEKPTTNHLIAFALIIAAAYFAVKK